MRKILRKIFNIGGLLSVVTLVSLSIVRDEGAYFDAIMAGIAMLCGLHFVSAFLFKSTMYGGSFISTADGAHPWSRMVMCLLGVIIVTVAISFLI